jgi:serine/threonine protein kinase
MTLDAFLDELSNLSVPGKSFKPHKYLAVLAVVKLVRQGTIKSQRIPFDAAFRSTFSGLLKTFGGDEDRDRPHNPFFHLRRHSFWRLVAQPGQEKALDAAPTIGSGTDLSALASHGELEKSVFELFKDPMTSERIERKIGSLVRAGIESRSEDREEPAQSPTESLFAHEASALDSIRQHINSHGLGVVLTNLELHDPQSNRYFEVDLVVVSEFGIYVVELKHWSGVIEVRPNSWVQNNSFFKPDPHKVNNFKSKLLKGLCERKFPQFPQIYFESVVVFTNPDVTVHGASIPNTTSHNPTFESIDRFLQYLKNQRQGSRSSLTGIQCKLFADYINKLQTTSIPRDFVFPGYEVVERLYQHVDRAEVIAKRTDIRHRRLSRLRIFYPASEKSEGERRRAHERATATLNAVAKVGEHPNVLKVWSIPNENNYVIEGSDWSETGTLRDVLEREARMSSERARNVAIGLARGLYAIHEQYVIHRFLAPENVLMVDDTPKLMNFDLSFQLEDDRLTVIPDATKLKRSPYFAPEIYVGREIPDGRADLFTLGVILYEMLSGSRPFGCSTDLEQSHGKLTSAQLQQLAKHDVPGRLQDLVCDLVQQSPANRPPDVLTVLKRLEVVQDAAVEVRQVNPQLLPGQQCNLYEIEEFIGRGAESQLYRAVGVTGRKIALKMFDRDVPQQRIVNEHRLSGAILHPTIVRVDSYSLWDDGRYFIAFDWVGKRNVRDDIIERVRPNIERFTTVANQVLNAVAALHQNTDEDGRPDPILHNDIKPENILLADRDRPVLVDFGAASAPHIGTYQGSEGYVAPDLRLGQDRKYCEDGDLYALAVTLHEWLFGIRPGEHDSGRSPVSTAVVDWLHKGCASDATERFVSARHMREGLASALAWNEPLDATIVEDVVPSLSDRAVGLEVVESEETKAPPTDAYDPNPFVPYLNSLHSRNAETDNALAEAQARNPLFGFIHVPHPLVMTFETTLLGSKKRHVIVTGHAGDGKSTIAVELIKRLRGLPPDQPLATPLRRREDITARGISLSFVKDFSEWSPPEQSQLLAEMLAPEGRRFFLISNTGTMLDTFKTHEQATNGDSMRIESELLGAISKSGGSDLQFHDCSFYVVNIAMIDNLGIAQQIFERMLRLDRWKTCHSHECRHHCPILKNVALMQANQAVVTERLFIAYRRMYEYGHRLTLRQLCAHLAYMITSGLNYQDILRISERARPPLMSEFMFFNRFFGDNGREVDQPALQLRALRAVRDQGFGVQSCPTWERKLWLTSRTATFQLRAPDSPDDFARLQSIGAGLESSDLVTAAQAREQVRRAVFFLHTFDGTDASFLRVFLKSIMVLDFARWQTQPSETLSLQETASLQRRILHVLQEHFTGVRLPEGTPSDRHLFVTLSRRSHDVRQSAQVVLAGYPEEEFRIRLVTQENGGAGLRRELVLDGPGLPGTLLLRLGLPFLDYVMMRNQGEVGQDLQTSFVDRLERFKGQLIQHAESRNTDDIMLVRLRTNNTFRRQIFSVRGERLEVTDG